LKTLGDFAPAGTAELPLAQCNAGFGIGDEIVIDPGSPLEEHNRIVGFGSFILEKPTTYDHLNGVFVERTKKCTGSDCPLTPKGFVDVTTLCCPVETEQFFNRLVNASGLKVCSVPHVQGLMHWFSCVPEMDLDYVNDVIRNGNPCKYWAPKDEECPEVAGGSAECAGSWCGK